MLTPIARLSARAASFCLLVILASLATACKGDSATATPVPTTITLNSTAELIGIGGSFTFVATVKDQFGNTMTPNILWSSDAPTIAWVASGVVTGIAAGTTMIHAEVGGKSATATVTVSGAAAPVATIIDPIVTRAGSGSFTLTVTGSNFTPSSVVLWNGEPRTTTFVNSTKLTATIAANDVAATGTRQVSVRNGATGSATSSTIAFAVTGAQPSVSTSDYTTCALAANGSVRCWGEGFNGQLGFGQRTNSTTPVTVSGATVFKAISVGRTTVCALATDGQPWCWGLNVSGRLGTAASDLVVTVPSPVVGAPTFTWIAAGSTHACGIDVNLDAWCWGDNDAGQLGDGTQTRRTAPTRVTGGHKFTQVTAGQQATCGITLSGALLCWGSNALGRLGDGTTTALRTTPTLVISSGVVASTMAIAGGCAVKDNGDVWCWGANENGRVGDGTFVNALAPVRVQGITNATSVTYGQLGGCATTRNGEAWCWGDNRGGFLGTGGSGSGPFKLQLPGLTHAISIGEMHLCAANTAGQVSCAGYRAFGGLGDGKSSIYPSPQPVAGNNVIRQIVGGDEYHCGLLANSQATCWGLEQLSPTSYRERATPTLVAGNLQYQRLSGGAAHVCGVTAAEALYCWGDNSSGQIGNGTTTLQVAPAQVQLSRQWKRVATGAMHTCGNTATEIFCWGEQQGGRLGNGLTSSAIKSLPEAVTQPVVVGDMSAGTSSTCAVEGTSSARVFCWGANAFGSLGNGTASASAVPTAIALDQPFRMVSVGYFHACGLTTAGRAYCWGSNGNGQLGIGTFSQSVTQPTAVAPELEFSTIAAGETHTCGVVVSGALYCWGTDLYGESGRADRISVSTPTLVAGAPVFVQLQLSRQSSCGVTQAGAAYCWGWNDNGKLGIGALDLETLPKVVQGVSAALIR